MLSQCSHSAVEFSEQFGANRSQPNLPPPGIVVIKLRKIVLFYHCAFELAQKSGMYSKTLIRYFGQGHSIIEKIGKQTNK